MKKTVQAPVVNKNGTSKDALKDEIRSALAAVNAAISAVHDITCHGRDFQTAAPGTFETYSNEHNDRIGRLFNVRDELLDIRMQIEQQPY